MSDISQVKRQLDELTISLNQRRTETLRRQSEAQRELDALNRELKLLSETLDALQPAKNFYSAATVSQAASQALQPQVKTRVEPGHNRKAIVEILTLAGRSLRIAEISKTAFEQGKIRSRKGYEGVYATVSTVLSRNSKHVFVNALGQWDLRVHKNKPKEGMFGQLIQGLPLEEDNPPVPIERVRLSKVDSR